MELIKQAKENKEKIEILNEKKKTTLNIISKEISEIENEYHNKIYELEDEMRKEVDILDKSAEAKRKEYEEKVVELYKPTMELKNIFKVFNIMKNKQQHGLNTPKVYHFDYLKDKNGYSQGDKIEMFYNPRGVIGDNEFIKLFAYITTNRKPLNSTSLILVGNTHLNSLLSEKYTYGIDAHTQDANIRVLIKDFKTEEEAKAYFEKNKDKLLKDWLEEHKKAEEYYIEKVKLWNNKEYKIAYYEDLKDYYENHCSNGTETEEYKEVLRKLENLNAGRQEWESN